MSKKNTIRLTESELKRVIAESVKNILNEIGDSEESRSSIRKAVKDDSAKRIKGLMKGTYKSENFTDKNGKKWVSRKAARNQNILDNLNKKGEKESNREKVVSEGMSYRLTESELKKVISESVKKVLKESEDNPFAWDGKYADGGSDMSYDELYDAGVSFKDAWHNFAKAMTRSGFLQNNRQLVEQWYNAQKPLYDITTEIIFHAGGMYKED